MSASRRHRDSTNRNIKIRLWIVIAIATAFMLGEVVGGIIAKSLAIIADAAHILSDISGLVVSLVAIKLSAREPNCRYTYGYWQAEVIGALLSIMIIWTTTIILFFEAIERFISPEDVDGVVMFSLGVAGLVVNAIMMLVLGHNHSHGHSHGHDDRVAMMTTPMLMVKTIRQKIPILQWRKIQSVGVVIAAALIWWKPFDIGSTSDGVSHWNYFDPICTVIFSVLVLLTTTRTLRRSLRALMHKAPEHVDVHLLQTKLREIPYVDCVHDVHVWNVGSANTICTAHVAFIGYDNSSAVLAEAKAVASDMGISHSTFQLGGMLGGYRRERREGTPVVIESHVTLESRPVPAFSRN
ncbi:hypothetical protein FOZ60_014687 [Perkinsus olseni]|uniref:Cation efflux protein transmembrane domain-containing protein n=1 Tax=Perkinsus olseni TaxID=32597 RepID=A0A7J6PMT0_PEROL|nr:hypothetical protein FOZ60_014687 [Perkinsus olseni]